MAIQLLQDIHLADTELWTAFQNYWDDGNYVAAVNLLNNNQELITKYVSAEWLNSLTAFVYILENNTDDNLKANKIKLSYIPPSLATGGIYFQIENDDVLIDVSTAIIDTANTSVDVSYSNKLINFIAFKNLEVIRTNVSFTSSIVTFSVDTVPDNAIFCFVFSSNNSNITVVQSPMGSSVLTTSVSYTGTLLSAFATDNSGVVAYDITIQNSTANFTRSLGGTNAVCRVTVIANAQIGTLLYQSIGNITTSNKSLILDCQGELINSIVLQNNDMVWTDVTININKVVLSVANNPSTTLNCTIFYD